MIGVITLLGTFAVAGYQAWKKNSEEEITESLPLIVNKEVDLVSFLSDVDNGLRVIPMLIESEDWFKESGPKVSVEKNGKDVDICLHLPNYTLRSQSAKLPEYMRACGEWRKKLNYDFNRNVELRCSYKEGDESYVEIIPEEVTSAFSDERDPSGACRLYEALMMSNSRNNDQAENAIADHLGELANEKEFEIVIRMSFEGIDNDDLLEILKTPLVIVDREGNEKTPENIIFSSELGSIYDFNEDGTIQDYAISF